MKRCISVSKKDIQAAKKMRTNVLGSRATTCPIAQALTRLGYTNVSVSNSGYLIDGTHYWLSKGARAFVAKTDSKKDRVKPQAFILQVPE